MIQPAPRSRVSSMIAPNAPATGLRPPARMLVTVPMVAPDPGRAPNTPATTLAEPLAYEFPIGVVAGAGERVGHQRSQQAIDGAEDRNDQRRLDNTRNQLRGKLRHLERGQAGGKLSDNDGIGAPEERRQSGNTQGGQGCRQKFVGFAGPEDA